MALKIDKTIDSISIVANNVHDVERVNSVEGRYKALRQDSKAPTFCTYLSGDVYHPDKELWLR